MPKVVVTAKIAKEGPHNEVFAAGGFAVAFPPANCDVFQEDALISQLKDVEAVLARHGAKMLEVDHPTTNLEDLFIKTVRDSAARPGQRYVPPAANKA